MPESGSGLSAVVQEDWTGSDTEVSRNIIKTVVMSMEEMRT